MAKRSAGTSLTFDSEYLLQQAIAGLLSKMPNVSGVQILQGPQEIGKDIIFYVPGGLADRLLCACVIKNKKITGTVASSSGTRTVALQAQQVLDTPHAAAVGLDEWVQRVYVISPYPVDPSAMASIKGLLKEKHGLVSFIGGPDLFDLFRKHWPDFVADEADAIARYIADAKAIFEQTHPIAEVASMYHLGEIEKGSTWIYIPQLFERAITPYWPGDGVEQSIPSFDSKWKKSELKKAIYNLRRLDGVLKTVTDWGFGTSFDYQGFNRQILATCQGLEGARRGAMKESYKVPSESVDRIGPDAAVFLNERPRLEAELEAVRVTANLALAMGIDTTAQCSVDIVNSEPTPKELLVDKRFLDICAFTAVRLKLEQNQLVDVVGEIGVLVDRLKSA